MNGQPEFLPDEVELRHAVQDLSAVERLTEGSAGDPEVLEGPEYSVTTESTDGMHLVVDIVGAADPGLDGLVGQADEAEQAVLRSLVRSLLDLVGHESGPARTRVVLTPAGPRVLECLREASPAS